MANEVNVNIKMYRLNELGDCFLLRFTTDAAVSHILIDCGSYWNSDKSKQRLNQIATDIQGQINGHKLNVIIGTHQHNDHLSGFIHAKKTFENMLPEQVWLSWLDDPGNKRAREIGVDFNNYLTALTGIRKNLERKAFAMADNTRQMLDGFLHFQGIDMTSLATRTTKKPATLSAEARRVLQDIGRQPPQYLSAGEVLDLPGLRKGAVKVYVLGPPKKDEYLYKTEPRKHEAFDARLAMQSSSCLQLAESFEKFNSADSWDKDPFPFNETYRKSSNFKAVYNAYYKPADEWRQIEVEWVKQAARLGLWLDTFTNNSSLALAFEIVGTGKVLLFPADAQAGNWRSWQQIKWQKKGKDFNWLSLMKNTVLYKVGHHGSVNATLKQALDNMTHDELIALLPVDKTDPMIKTAGWNMPATNLYKELKKRTKNRIIRMDDGISVSAAWKEIGQKPTQRPLYWECEING